MPWTETEPMKERVRFVADAERGLYSMSELCERYGISRRTGYKWLERYEAEGPAGLKERSRAPHHCPHRIEWRLAVVDHHWSYLLACAALASVRTGDTRASFERVFREVGLPAAIQSDNGTPFCSTGLHGLSALNVWWMRLGIRPVRIEPSHPEQ